MGVNFGSQVNLAKGAFPASGKVTIPVVTPRGKPTFARKLTVNNTGATALTVIFPQSLGDAVNNPDVGQTVAPGAVRDFEGAIWSVALQGTNAATYEVTATVAG